MRTRLKLQQQQSQVDEQLEPQILPPSINTNTSKNNNINNNNSTAAITTNHQIGTNNDEDKSTQDSQTAVERFGSGLSVKSHWLGAEIDRVCAEQLSYARQGVGEGGNGWQLFADEGEMKMYRREEEVNGMVIDPLKACHVVKGVSAREMCHYFYSPEFRNDWESK